MNSILNSVKDHVGLSSDYSPFDSEIIDDINVALATLTQLGVGDRDGYEISSSVELWEEFIPNDKKLLSLCKTFVEKKTKLLFDPPTNSVHLNALNETINETSWRIHEYVMFTKGD